MKLTKQQLQTLKYAYEEHFKDANWGSWDISHAPDLGIGYRLLQYENDKGQTADVIKFDKPVHPEGKRVSGKVWVLGKHNPNHRVTGYLF
ncbi:MAG: hypothetical protein K9I68_02440 [Bacteroidales bacterium]|nr:hypothetical protein [Bacteroidales bacterium]MCF8337172.1 hypothetical protein [Bacteroidales bacterium]